MRAHYCGHAKKNLVFIPNPPGGLWWCRNCGAIAEANGNPLPIEKTKRAKTGEEEWWIPYIDQRIELNEC